MVMSSSEAVLSVHEARLKYRNGALGILNISFDVAPGQIIGLFGANGAGKTSSVRAASGFVKGEGAKIIHGRVVLDGHDVTNPNTQHQANTGLAFSPEQNK